MKELLCNNTMFGIVLCALLWQAGLWCQNKIKKPIANPLFISMVLGVIVLVVFDIPLEWFRRGANMMDMLLLPATAALGLSVWRQRKVLLDNFWPVVIGWAKRLFLHRINVMQSLFWNGSTSSIPNIMVHLLSGLYAMMLMLRQSLMTLNSRKKSRISLYQ